MPAEDERLQIVNMLRPDETAWEFQALATLASHVSGTPYAAISVIGEHEQVFLAELGIGCHSTPREVAFCNRTIQLDQPLIVEDASLDPEFRENPFVTGNFHLRFYAGIPLNVFGATVGSLCVIDVIPRRLSEKQLNALHLIAGLACNALRVRASSPR